MKIIAYIHPSRTFLPCTGAGRHINNTLLGIAKREGVHIQLLFSDQWLTNQQKLPENCPLQSLPFLVFPFPENRTERLWKLIGFPKMDQYILDGVDWLFAPMETYFPVTKCPTAITIYDIQAFEPNLLWSQTWQHRWSRYKWGRWVSRAIDHSRIIFTISEFSKQRMVELLHAPAQKIINVGCGVELPFFEIAKHDPANLNLLMPSPYTFMVGGLRQKKGGDHYLALAKELRQRRSPIQILIAGQIDPVYAEVAKAHSNITLLGVVPDEELPKLMRGSLCLLFLSLYEGFGIPPLEAMAAGVPAIVANRASLPEVVGDAGIVVEPDATHDIVDWLEALEKSSGLRQDYSQRGQRHAAQFTWDKCVDKVVQALIEYA
jgi:glycosyltransferase involved in cell wall biosynthesis